MDFGPEKPNSEKSSGGAGQAIPLVAVLLAIGSLAGYGWTVSAKSRQKAAEAVATARARVASEKAAEKPTTGKPADATATGTAKSPATATANTTTPGTIAKPTKSGESDLQAEIRRRREAAAAKAKKVVESIPLPKPRPIVKRDALRAEIERRRREAQQAKSAIGSAGKKERD